MKKLQQLDTIRRSGLIAIIRWHDASRLTDVAEALLAGGVHVMEVTFTVPKAVELLERMRDKLQDRIVLGAGTVLDPQTARAAILAGAEFIVSPHTQPEVIRTCRRYATLCMPGALTPTEVLNAWETGADLVKLFPADIGGPRYLRTLKGPLPQVPLMPTGGIDLNSAADYLKAGAVALGLGGSLVQPDALRQGNLTRIESLARQFVEIVQHVRQDSGESRPEASE